MTIFTWLWCGRRALKGLSPSHSQQLELEDALASTAYMEGPCGPPDDGLSKQPYLWRCFASCIHFWGALLPRTSSSVPKEPVLLAVPSACTIGAYATPFWSDLAPTTIRAWRPAK